MYVSVPIRILTYLWYNTRCVANARTVCACVRLTVLFLLRRTLSLQERSNSIVTLFSRKFLLSTVSLSFSSRRPRACYCRPVRFVRPTGSAVRRNWILESTSRRFRVRTRCFIRRTDARRAVHTNKYNNNVITRHVRTSCITLCYDIVRIVDLHTTLPCVTVQSIILRCVGTTNNKYTNAYGTKAYSLAGYYTNNNMVAVCVAYTARTTVQYDFVTGYTEYDIVICDVNGQTRLKPLCVYLLLNLGFFFRVTETRSPNATTMTGYTRQSTLYII